MLTGISAPHELSLKIAELAPPFTVIDHVQLAMPAGKEEAARRFYSGLLGMTEIQKPTELAKRSGCWFASGSVQVHLGVEAEFSSGEEGASGIQECE